MQRPSHIWLKHPSCSGRPKNILKQKQKRLQAGCAGGDGTYLLDKEFFAKETILQNYVVREILERLSGHRNDLTAGHIRQVQKLYENQSGRKISLPYGVEASALLWRV